MNRKQKRRKGPLGHQTEGVANANIFVFSRCIGGAFSTRIDKDGDESTETIFALRSSIPGGIGGDAGSPTLTAHQILDERYARGEIDREEYLRRRKDISGE